MSRWPLRISGGFVLKTALANGANTVMVLREFLGDARK